jgi:hypothetical protein
MYDPPGYLWAMTIGGIVAILAATCVVLYGGAIRAGAGRRRAGVLAGGAAFLIIMALGHLPALFALPAGLVHVTPSGAAISELPVALVPTVGVPLLFAVHITPVTTLARSLRTPKPATALIAAAAK